MDNNFDLEKNVSKIYGEKIRIVFSQEITDIVTGAAVKIYKDLVKNGISPSDAAVIVKEYVAAGIK